MAHYRRFGNPVAVVREDNELAGKASGIVNTYILLVLENGITAENHLVLLFVLRNLTLFFLFFKLNFVELFTPLFMELIEISTCKI